MVKNHSSEIKYRKDINGLRAWAVIAVLLFHFSLIGLPGGFIGVDVFFVISGYLMTAIILDGFNKENFSIMKFYRARIRRILPALFFVVIILLILGWFYLPTLDYKELANQSLYSISFISNIGYWKTSGYFDSASHEKFLLHTWSLAVEAQFYILYPIFLSVILKIFKNIKAVSISIILIFIISLSLSIIGTTFYPSASFYLLPTRVWELTAGGIVFILSINNFKLYLIDKYGYVLGWFLIIGSFTFIDQDFLWPSYWAVIPVIGTCLILLIYRENSIFTDNYIAQWLGNRSYSLYLWHWPLVVILYFYSLQNDWLYVLIAFIISILLSDISYKFIENPTRSYLTKISSFKEMFIITGMILFIVILILSIKLLHFDYRIPKLVDIVANESNNKSSRINQCSSNMYDLNVNNGCKFGNENIGALLVGDSHAESVAEAIIESASNNEKGIFYRAMIGCSSIKDFEHYLKSNEMNRKNACKYFNENGLRILNNFDSNIPLVIVNRFSVYFLGSNLVPQKNEAIKFRNDNLDDNLKRFEDTLCEYQKSRQVYVVRPIPEIGINVPKILSREMLLKDKFDDIKIQLSSYYERNKIVINAQNNVAEKCGVKILNPIPYLCDENFCYGSKDNIPLYFDDNHLSEFGNKLLIPMFEEIFKNQDIGYK